MKRNILLGVLCGMILSGCSAQTVAWNGAVEYYAHVSMAVDETDLYTYVGVVDYVFVGTVEEIVRNVLPDEPGSSD